MGSDIDVTGRWNASRPSSTSVALRRAPIVPPRLDLLGAMRYAGIGSPGHGVATKNTTAYVYMCEVSHLSWWYDAPEKEKVTEVGVFRTLPDPIASESVEVVLEAALRA